jgi:maltose O-acetyltransferase
MKALLIPRTWSLPVKFVASYLGVLVLRIQVWWHGGRCRIGQAVRVKHPVVFQGAGALLVSDRVTLGYELAGGIKSPILLQPREPEAVIRVGERTSIMNGCELIARASIRIGARCRIGPHTLIYDADFHGLPPAERDEPGKTAPVTIADNVWIGSRSVILKGVTIGQDAVVAAGSVVVKDVRAGTVAAGNPAREIGSVHDSQE